MRSIRTALIFSTTIATVTVLLIAGGYVYFGVRAALLEQFDKGLQEDARILASMTDIYSSKIKIDFEVLDKTDFDATSDLAYLQIWIEDQIVLYRSPNLNNIDLALFAGTLESPEYHSLPDDGRGGLRGVGVRFIPSPEEEDPDELEDPENADTVMMPLDDDYRGQTATLVLARRTDSIDALLARLRGILMVLSVVAGAIAVATLSIIIRRNLSPLDSLARRIAELQATDVSTRVELQHVPTEIQPVVDRLNGLLQRIDEAMQRERSFSAHLAHELRTPVCALRSTIEVARSRPRDTQEYEAVMGECLAIVYEMQDMVESLLYLCRLEAGQIELKADAVDLREIVLDSWAHLQEIVQSRRLQANCDLPDSVVVSSDGGLLSLAIRNILENAVVHSDEGGFVRVAVHNVNGRVDLQVSNSGSRITSDHLPKLFDRFWRGDEARSSTGIHSGLGLSVVKNVADVLGGTLAVESVGGEFLVTLSLSRSSRKPTKK